MHPRWIHLRIHFYSTITIGAIASTWCYHPSCLSRNWSARAFGLLPGSADPSILKELLGLIPNERRRQEGCERPSALIIENISPSGRAIAHLPYQGQIYFPTRLLPQCVGVLVGFWPSLSVSCALCTITCGVALEALRLGGENHHAAAWASPIAWPTITASFAFTFASSVAFAFAFASVLSLLCASSTTCISMGESAAIASSAVASLEVTAHLDGASVLSATLWRIPSSRSPSSLRWRPSLKLSGSAPSPVASGWAALSPSRRTSPPGPASPSRARARAA
mmetsp:Transcript_22565/g.52544  ORF Transcript_22565/g.52544 Transcript_22565/m.52544 type:complete len:280 (-) Transcript_22565:1434-2273(-)